MAASFVKRKRAFALVAGLRAHQTNERGRLRIRRRGCRGLRAGWCGQGQTKRLLPHGDRRGFTEIPRPYWQSDAPAGNHKGEGTNAIVGVTYYESTEEIRDELRERGLPDDVTIYGGDDALLEPPNDIPLRLRLLRLLRLLRYRAFLDVVLKVGHDGVSAAVDADAPRDARHRRRQQGVTGRCRWSRPSPCAPRSVRRAQLRRRSGE